MSLLDAQTVQSIKNQWIQKRDELKLESFVVPDVVYGVCQGNILLTVNDHSTVFTFVSRCSNIYVAVRSKCHLEGDHYVIDDSAPQMISCSTDKTNKSAKGAYFVISTLVPFVFPDIRGLKKCSGV